jgi:hypothetical protein
MNVWKPIALAAIAATVASVGTQIASAGDKHPNLTAAADNLTKAAGDLSRAQQANEYDLGGHAAKAKDLIAAAQTEVGLARQAAK